MKRVVPLLALLASIAFAAACGESDEDKFVEEVNEICTDAAAEVDPSSSGPEFIRAFDMFLADLEKVEPPEDKKERYEGWLTAQRRIIEESRAAIRAKDRQRINGIDTTTLDERSRELGFTDCD